MGPCELTLDDLPDTEDGFARTNHYISRKSERIVPDEYVDQILTEPAIVERSENDGTYIVRRWVGGREWNLVFTEAEEGDPLSWALVTVYPST